MSPNHYAPSWMAGAFVVGRGKQVCSTTGCSKLVDRGLCNKCQREKDQARGSTAQRGYGAEHRRTRAALLEDAYGRPCPHCGERMWPHQELHLDHTEDRKGYRGIVHGHCNTSEGATRGNRDRT